MVDPPRAKVALASTNYGELAAVESLSLWSSRREFALLGESHCLLHIDVEVTNESDDDELDLMLTRGRAFLERFFTQIIRRGFVLRVDVADHDYQPWQWPLLIDESTAVREALAAIPMEASDYSKELYPCSVWLYMRDHESLATALIDAYRGDALSEDRLNQLLDSNIVAGTLLRGTLCLSAVAHICQGLEEDVVNAARESGYHAQWI
jgi:hypothetical protein